ncbi:MAG: hypothetical protein GXP55_06465 [Deltaproteobacteria bacterium]|nr:hypothetical protein [Deltaproteobacteria bacterium]
MTSKRQKRQKKSGAQKKRPKKHHGSASQAEQYESSGALSSMVGGFKRAVGVSAPRKRGALDHVWTFLLLAAVVGVIAWRFF